MAANNAALQQLLARQKQELEENKTLYIDLESKIAAHKSDSNYEELDTPGKAQYTRKLNELTKQRDSILVIVNGVNKRVATTSSLLQGSSVMFNDTSIRSGSSGSQPRTSSIRIPTLPRYRGNRRDAVADPFDFIDQCHSLFIAHDLPEEKWVTVLLTALTTEDRQWAKENLLDRGWEEVKKLFLSHFESPLIKEQLLTALE